MRRLTSVGAILIVASSAAACAAAMPGRAVEPCALDSALESEPRFFVDIEWQPPTAFESGNRLEAVKQSSDPSDSQEWRSEFVNPELEVMTV